MIAWWINTSLCITSQREVMGKRRGEEKSCFGKSRCNEK
jgi:hypothetical protein